MKPRDQALIAAAALAAFAVPALLLRVPNNAIAPAPGGGAIVEAAAPPLALSRALFAETTSAEPALDGQPILVGIVGRLPDSAVALVRTAEGRTRPIAVGEVIDGWRLASLAAEAALFTRGRERARVELASGEAEPLTDEVAAP